MVSLVRAFSSDTRDDVFVDMLQAQAEAAHEAASLLHALTVELDRIDLYQERLQQLRNHADNLAYTVTESLNAPRPTPLAKEDLRALAGHLNTIINGIEAAVTPLAVARLAAPRTCLMALTALLVAITQETAALMRLLRQKLSYAALPTVIASIQALKAHGGRVLRAALADLQEDASLIVHERLQWQEVYRGVEAAINACAKLAACVETLTPEYA